MTELKAKHQRRRRQQQQQHKRVVRKYQRITFSLFYCITGVSTVERCAEHRHMLFTYTRMKTTQAHTFYYYTTELIASDFKAREAQRQIETHRGREM